MPHSASEKPGDFNFEAAAKLPANIKFGTSSWNYPGWLGSVYTKTYATKADFTKKSLEEYGRFPWFRTVGIDSSFYAPLDVETLRRYADMLLPEIAWVSKVWEEITIPVYGKHKRYGARAGKPNPNFLNVDLLESTILEPYRKASLVARNAGLVLEFQALPSRNSEIVDAFLEQLQSFCKKLPTDFRFATEVRTPEVLQPRYFDTLNQCGITHCFNHWTDMPPLEHQMRLAAESGGLSSSFFIARILTPRGLSYESAVKRFQPYDKIKQPNPELRRDVVRLARRAIKLGIDAYILVNNRAEGYAPGTIDAIGSAIVESLENET